MADQTARTWTSFQQIEGPTSRSLGRQISMTLAALNRHKIVSGPGRPDTIRRGLNTLRGVRRNCQFFVNSRWQCVGLPGGNSSPMFRQSPRPGRDGDHGEGARTGTSMVSTTRTNPFAERRPRPGLPTPALFRGTWPRPVACSSTWARRTVTCIATRATLPLRAGRWLRNGRDVSGRATLPVPHCASTGSGLPAAFQWRGGRGTTKTALTAISSPITRISWEWYAAGKPMAGEVCRCCEEQAEGCRKIASGHRFDNSTRGCSPATDLSTAPASGGT